MLYSVETIADEEGADYERRAQLHEPLDEDETQVAYTPTQMGSASLPDAVEAFEGKWRQAQFKALLDHVFNRTALSDQSRAIYRAYALEEGDVHEVAGRFGVTPEVPTSPAASSGFSSSAFCAVSCLIIFRFIPYSKETMVALILAFSLPGSYAIPMFGKFEGHRDYVSTSISFSTLVTLLVFVGLTVYVNL